MNNLGPSDESDTGSIDELVPNTLDLSDGDFKLIKTDYLSILSINIDSITSHSKLDQLELLVKELNLSALAISESKLDDTISESTYSIPGYNMETRHRNRHGGGVMIFIRDNIPYCRKETLESKTLEHIAIDLTVGNKKYAVNVIYRPPNDSPEDHRTFLTDMSSTLSIINKHRAHTKIICGDFNFGSAAYNFHGGLRPKPLDSKAPALFSDNGFEQVIDIPTRYVRNSTSLIDLIFIDKTDNLILTAVTPAIADHAGTMLSLNTLSRPTPPKTFMKFDYARGDWSGIESVLLELGDHKLYQNADTNTIANTFSNKLIKAREEFIPHKKVTLREKDKPWLDADVRKQLTKRNQQYNRFRKAKNRATCEKSNNPADNIKRHSDADRESEKYTIMRNEYKKVAKKAKRTYFKELKNTMEDPDISPRKKFGMLERLTNTGKNACVPPLIDNDTVHHEPIEKADIFNKHFMSKATVAGADDEPPHLEPMQTLEDLTTIVTGHFELGPLVKNMKKADFSPCGLPSKFLQETYRRFGTLLTQPLSMLLNHIFDTGHYPDRWKLAHVTPVYKRKGPRTDKINYRPISILPTLSKICESVIHDRLCTHLLENNIITDKQAAYLTGDSTAQQLLYLTHKIKEAWANNQIVQAIFLDVSAAFDAVWHKGLMAKLKQTNVSGKLLDLMSSYLDNRSTVTVVDGVKSDPTPIRAGVPQGSRLGPILFILYMNDIIKDLTSLPLIYADDTTLAATGSNTSETTEILNRDLSKISQWAKIWKVKFNASKSKDMIFSNKIQNNSLPAILDDTVIDRVGRHKHLGVSLTPTLEWDTHLNNVLRLANLKMSTLYKVKELSRTTLATLYKMHVRSCIEYCLQVYGNGLNKTQIAKLERIQYRAARLATGTLTSTSSAKLHEELGWETITTRIKHLSLNHFHKIVTNNTRPLIRELIPPLYPRSHLTRTNKIYDKYNVTSKALDNSFFPKTVNQWNELPKNISSIVKHTKFRAALNAHYKPKPCKVFNQGDKYINRLHTQIRLGRTQLNENLFNLGLSETKECLCGSPSESSAHFLLDCFLYDKDREELFKSLDTLLEKRMDMHTRSEKIDILLRGVRPDLPSRLKNNSQIFICIHKFISKTNRLKFDSPLQLIP
jgi:hypothetical protein